MTPKFTITGTLLDANFGYPLAGMRILALRVGPGAAARAPSTPPKEKDIEARAVSDAAGAFHLTVTAHPPKRRFPGKWRKPPTQTTTLRVEGADGSAYLVLAVTLPRQTPITLRVPIQPRTVSAATWAEFGARLERARIGRLHEAVRQLTTLGANGIFADWDAETRLGVIAGLEQAFLDPHGTLRAASIPIGFNLPKDANGTRQVDGSQPKLAETSTPALRLAQSEMAAKTATFRDLSSVDWPIHPEAFMSGNPGAALTAFQPLYQAVHHDGQAVGKVGGAGSGQPLPQDEASRNLIGYRDYLRAIWVELKKETIELSSEWDSAHEYAAVTTLNQRFHQDFRITDTRQTPANELLIAILTDILITSGGADYGFALPRATIADRGTRPARQYLDYLIGLTGYSAHELGLRYRLDFERNDSAMSSAVQENIATLQGFYRDSFQSDGVLGRPEPFPIIPPVQASGSFAASSRIPSPFFLEYEEWLASIAPFFPENFYQARPTYALGTPRSFMYGRDDFGNWMPHYADYSEVYSSGGKWIGIDFDTINDALTKGKAAFFAGRYPDARQQYDLLCDTMQTAMKDILLFKAATIDETFDLWGKQAALKVTALSTEALDWFQWRRALPADTMEQLQVLMLQYNMERGYYNDNVPRMKAQFSLIHLAATVLPVVYGDIELAMGNYAEAIAHYLNGCDRSILVGIAGMEDGPGWREAGYVVQPGHVYQAGDLPYTFDAVVPYFNPSLYSNRKYPDASLLVSQGLTHRVEERFMCLRLGNALLDWADALYRSNEPSSMQRARELYKGVLMLHGETPPVVPHWDAVPAVTVMRPDIVPDVASAVASIPGYISSPVSGFVAHTENPALTSQKSRARLGFAQLEAGLNYYGYHDDVVPTLRFRPLKDAADQFAALAKVAQQDWLAFMGKIEDAVKDSITTTNMLKRAKIQSEIVDDQAQNAEYAVTLANRQVDAVRDAIEKKKQEIADHDSFWGQVSDFASGFSGALSSLPDMVKPDKGTITAATSSDAAGYSSTAEADAEATGISAADADEAAALGAGASIMAGYGAFYYASYKSLSGMADAANQRRDDLNTLETKTLPAAQEQVRVKQRDVDIIHLQGALIQADVDLANNLIAFQVTRTLSPEFWAHLATVMQRVLRRYLDLGARTAWLAERALTYEQDRPLHLIRFDYYPTQLYGTTGADLLQADLVELEASRLAGIRETVPIKHTFSLARDFPLQFGQLLKTGRCAFRTEEEPFHWAYPGTYGYRIRAVTVELLGAQAATPLRGLLTNQGVSLLSTADGTNHISVRPSDAFALSEFRLRNDMSVYSLPDEALLAFEGSGVDTFWGLELPAAANPYGRDGLADVLLTFDVRASYSSTLYDAQLAAMPTTVHRLAIMSARHYQPKSLDALRSSDTMPVSIRFNFAALGLPAGERHRRINNLVLRLAGEHGTAPVVAALLASTGPTGPVKLVVENGVTLSNVPPITGAEFPAPAIPSPLNVFAGHDVAQAFTLTIDRTASTGVDFSSVSDVLLAIDYSADLA